ncbi:MAG: hypothetical protein B7Z75_09665 [Acidocella sp. 20-57-95]|nr:MAG: hypothetical protein B7Z75_09665 [Acidocella sp. 20-57-95]OYV62060.1 MAG: hypothetical protein B7Z71_02770 [Acidocella sp. 21-58-7]HQT65408.1 hypothetical protein [Acidocella sp.]HQU04090.1 hypothetical protein [Acidocella sp.]
MPAAIRTAYGAGGEMLHLIPFPPDQLPPVTKRDLEQAWEAARATALCHHGAPPNIHGFRFSLADGPPLDLLLTDPDAACWTSGISTIADLATAHGISVCLRLLALFSLMSHAAWTRPWFTLKRDGLEFNSALLQAAALAPLTPTGGFAETALRALLPDQHHGVTQEYPYG